MDAEPLLYGGRMQWSEIASPYIKKGIKTYADNEFEQITELLETLKKQHVPDSRITCLSLYEEQKKFYGADYPEKISCARTQNTNGSCVYGEVS